MKLISSDVASFLPSSVSALVRDAVAVAPFRGKGEYPPSVHSSCPFEIGQLICGFLPCLPCKALTGSPVSHSLIHLHEGLLEGLY